MKVTVIPIVNRALGTVLKGPERGLEGLKIGGQIKTVKTKNILKIGQNTEESHGYLRRLAVTQTPAKDYQREKLARNNNNNNNFDHTNKRYMHNPASPGE